MIDFHCHLDLYPSPAVVAAECDRRGIYILSVTTTPSAWPGTAALAKHYPRIRTALGLHPQLAHERRSELTLFDRYLPEARYVGEIGLDGGPAFKAHWKDQEAVFSHILESCEKVGGRVMTIHSLRAPTAVLDHLESRMAAGTPILHWFTGSLAELQRAIDMDCWFSVGPAMLASKGGRDLARHMPHDRVLSESDGPFARIDGEPLMPWQSSDVVYPLSQLWDVGMDTVQQHLSANLAAIGRRAGA